MKKKLLFFTSRVPGEPVGGRESSLHYYCKYLHSMYGLDIVVVSFSKAPGEEERSRLDFISKTYLVRPPRKLTILKNILKAVFISGWPIQVCLFYSSQIRDRVKEIVEQERPDY
ncbi:MAG: glycosyl transferase, partial [bacterium]